MVRVAGPGQGSTGLGQTLHRFGVGKSRRNVAILRPSTYDRDKYQYRSKHTLKATVSSMREIKVSWVRLRTSAGFRAVYTAGEYFAAQMKIRDGGLCKEYSRFTSHVP